MLCVPELIRKVVSWCWPFCVAGTGELIPTDTTDETAAAAAFGTRLAAFEAIAGRRTTPFCCGDLVVAARPEATLEAAGPFAGALPFAGAGTAAFAGAGTVNFAGVETTALARAGTVAFAGAGTVGTAATGTVVFASAGIGGAVVKATVTAALEGTFSDEATEAETAFCKAGCVIPLLVGATPFRPALARCKLDVLFWGRRPGALGGAGGRPEATALASFGPINLPPH